MNQVPVFTANVDHSAAAALLRHQWTADGYRVVIVPFSKTRLEVRAYEQLDPVAILTKAADDVNRDVPLNGHKVRIDTMMTLSNAVDYLRTGQIQGRRGIAVWDLQAELETAIDVLRARGIDATWEYPGFLAVGEWAFGVEDGELCGNTTDAQQAAEGIRTDLPIADAIEQFLLFNPENVAHVEQSNLINIGCDLASEPDKTVRALVVTPEVSELIGDLLDIAYDDQNTYLQYGNPAQDYGVEWPEVAQAKAERFCGFARLAVAVGLHGDQERWYDLAKAATEDGPGPPGMVPPDQVELYDRNAALRCECGRWPHECETYNDPKADHGDRT